MFDSISFLLAVVPAGEETDLLVGMKNDGNYLYLVVLLACLVLEMSCQSSVYDYLCSVSVFCSLWVS